MKKKVVLLLPEYYTNGVPNLEVSFFINFKQFFWML